jgi:hypothetical protein
MSTVKQSQDRMQAEIDTTLASYNLAELQNKSDKLKRLVDAIAANHPECVAKSIVEAMQAGCAAQDTEAVLRLCKSDFWIGKPPNAAFNLIIRSLYLSMASGCYKDEGSYAENFAALPIAKATVIPFWKSDVNGSPCIYFVRLGFTGTRDTGTLVASVCFGLGKQ